MYFNHNFIKSRILKLLVFSKAVAGVTNILLKSRLSDYIVVFRFFLIEDSIP